MARGWGRAVGIGLAVWAALAGVVAAKPQRIMSINGCADLLVLQMVPKSRIASVTYRARDAVRAFAPGLADGVATNDGRAEEVAYYHPDLIVAGRYTTERTKALARRAGVPVVELEDAEDFPAIRANLRALGRALGEAARAEALIARMDATLARLAAEPPARRLRVAVWTGGPVVPGRGALADAIIAAAGAVDAATGVGELGLSDFDVEGLVRLRPDALLQEDPRLVHPALRVEQGRHPLVRRLYAGRTVAVPETLYGCGLPQSADAAAELNAALARIAPPRSGP
jgi:iron complex transport system substrate-binding protein